MANYERVFGTGPNSTYGRGNFIREIPAPQRIVYDDFSGGLDFRNSKEDTPPNSSPNSLDIEVTLEDRIRPAPGTIEEESFASHSPTQVILQASLDYTSELVFFDPPFIGVKRGDTTEWFDVELPVGDRPFGSVNFGGTLLFSNGRDALFSREAGKEEVKRIEGGPAAHTFASFAGRVFAGASIIGGNREPLGVSWSAASSDPEAWDVFAEDASQTGAGSELLIDDMIQGNYIVALRSMGLDFLAVFMRHSIWIGRRTSQFNRPADFQPRVSSVGALTESVVSVTRFGVVHLHDSGVHIFDGNTTNLISGHINAELLPINKENLNAYRTYYNPLTKLLYLFTPVCTWVYDLEKGSWQKRSLIATDASLFAGQLPGRTWAELTGTWGSQDETWEEYKASELAGVELLFLGKEGGVTKLARESYESRENFGVTMLPYWESSSIRHNQSSMLFSTQGIDIAFVGEGTVNVLLPDNEGNFAIARSIVLPRRTTPDVRVSHARFTGRGGAVRIEFLDAVAEILRIELSLLMRSPRISTPPEAQVILTDEGVVVAGFYTNFADYTVGQFPAGWAVDPIVNDSSRYRIVQDGSSRFLRMKHPTGLGGSFNTFLNWALAGTLTGNVNVLMTVRSAMDDEAMRIKIWRNTAFTLSVEGQLRMTGDKLSVLKDRSIQTESGVGTMLLSIGTKYKICVGLVGTLMTVKGWVDGADESTATTLSHTIAGVATNTGQIGMEFAVQNGSNSIIDVFDYSFAVAGQTAPSAPPLPGWSVPPVGYSIRLSSVPEGVRIWASGIESTVTDGVAIVSRSPAPSTIDFLQPDGTLIKSIAAPTNYRSYSVDLYYT